MGIGRWFDDTISCEVGDGYHTLFSWDPWREGELLKNIFSRLFDLADNKMVLVAEMSTLCWERMVSLGSGGGCY